MTNTRYKHRGVTLLIVLALMVMFALLVTAFMVIVSQTRRTTEFNARFLIDGPPEISGTERFVIQRGNRLDEAFRRLLTGSEDNVIGPHSVLENLYGHTEDAEYVDTRFGGTGAGYNPSGTGALLSLADGAGKPFALRPNPLAPDANGNQRYVEHLGNDVQMNPDYTAPDYMTMFLAWNDYRYNDVQGKNTLERIIPSFHRPQLVRYWQEIDDSDDFNELRKYVLRPLPTDHPEFTGSNPAAEWRADRSYNQNVEALLQFLGADSLDEGHTGGPWDVDNDGDGIADGIWLDIDLPIISAPDGSQYKSLVSFHVIDLDGRINANTMGNNALSSSSGARGMGIGSAELFSELLTEEVLTTRYGTPGGVSDDILREQHGINFQAYTEGGVMADWFGNTPIDFDDWGNRISGTPILPAEIPYLMNPYSDAGGNRPFNSGDLESLLRSIVEIDYNRLQHRFRGLLGDAFNPNIPALTTPDLRYSLTTRSSDLPLAAKYVPDVDASGSVTGRHIFEARAEALGVWDLLPEEVREGRKVNLNRLTLRDDWMTGGDELLKAKVRFAQEMFYLMQVLFPEQATQSPEALERLAQWSVNLVDFIDPDDVMTPFIFKASTTTPGSVVAFDNADLIDELIAGRLTAQDLQDEGATLIWGFEKPEVAITETLAIHNRNVHHVTGGGPNGRFIQRFRPHGMLFVELYRQGNEERTTYPTNSVVKPDGRLDLAERTRDRTDGDYVWRLAIGEPAKTAPDRFQWENDNDREKNALRQLLKPDGGAITYPQFYQWWYDNPAVGGAGQYHADLGLGRPERFIWFGSVLPTDPEVRRRSFVNGINTGAATGTTLLPDSFLVIMPPELPTTLPAGFEPEETSFVSSFVSLPDPLPPNVTPMIATNRIAVTLKSGSGVSAFMGVSASERLPTQTLDDGYGALQGNPLPFDASGIYRQRGTVPCYKTIGLQRLADPNRPYDQICNPYITVDWSMIDLQVINSVELSNNGNPHESEHTLPSGVIENVPIPRDDNMHFSSRQWKQVASGFSNLWDRTLTEDELDSPKGGLEPTPYSFNSATGLMTDPPSHTFGESNHSPPFIHFPWHDAPFMNTGELMLVPASAPGRFGIEFHDNGSNNFYGIYDWLTQTGPDTTDKPRFGYSYGDYTFSPYPNWAGEQPGGAPSGMARLFEFVHVPSKFADATRRADGTVDREPGKFNLNTITEEGWEALRNGRDLSVFPSYAAFREYRQWSDEPNDPAYPSEFRPFRSPSATSLVPPLDSDPIALVGEPTSATLLDLGLIADDAINPYMALENVMRLSDVTTTRSNVFAIWITVGYFEVKKFESYAALIDPNEGGYPHLADHITPAMFDTVYPGGYVLGAEKGLNDGTVRRHRAFYLIDRSIPISVEFQRGEHTLDDVRSIIIRKTSLE